MSGYDLEKQGDLLVTRYPDDSDLRNFVHVVTTGLGERPPLVVNLEAECSRLRTKAAELDRALKLIEKALDAGGRA